jgi:hypothetical protein
LRSITDFSKSLGYLCVVTLLISTVGLVVAWSVIALIMGWLAPFEVI